MSVSIPSDECIKTTEDSGATIQKLQNELKLSHQIIKEFLEEKYARERADEKRRSETASAVVSNEVKQPINLTLKKINGTLTKWSSELDNFEAELDEWEAEMNIHRERGQSTNSSSMLHSQPPSKNSFDEALIKVHIAGKTGGAVDSSNNSGYERSHGEKENRQSASNFSINEDDLRGSDFIQDSFSILDKMPQFKQEILSPEHEANRSTYLPSHMRQFKIRPNFGHSETSSRDFDAGSSGMSPKDLQSGSSTTTNGTFFFRQAGLYAQELTEFHTPHKDWSYDECGRQIMTTQKKSQRSQSKDMTKSESKMVHRDGDGVNPKTRVGSKSKSGQESEPLSLKDRIKKKIEEDRGGSKKGRRSRSTSPFSALKRQTLSLSRFAMRPSFFSIDPLK